MEKFRIHLNHIEIKGEIIVAIDYSALKKGGFMRQKQKGRFSLRLQVVGGTLTSENLQAI